MTKGSELATGFSVPVDFHSYYHGLTKREYFASSAMRGLLSNSSTNILTFFDTASDAVNHADALISQLAKEKSDEGV